MNSPRDLRRRIRSISGTAQITRAMQMVAASKMRKAQQAALDARPFARLVYRIQRSVVTRAGDTSHPLLAVRDVRKRAVILVAADKGLCGALNTNVFRLAAQFDQDTTTYITAGRRAAQFVARSRRQLAAEFAYGDSPTFPEARAIAAVARDLFVTGEVDEVHIVATRFVNTLTQDAMTLPFLPIGELKTLEMPGVDAGDAQADDSEIVFEPSAERGARVPARALPEHLSLPGAAQRQGERAERAHGVDEERDRQRADADQGPDARVQQVAAGQHHQGTAGNCRRAGGLT